MCGIFGSFTQRPSLSLDGHLQAAQRSLQHRGPDDHGLQRLEVAGGVLHLGQTRLSIIDLTSGGHQPMGSPDGRYTIVFNGEIYNYRELRNELATQGRTFRTDSDTEVLLAAWERWGKDCLPRLTGMFAFALYDRASGALTCVRDPFGIKPFFYSAQPGGFAFASETPALIELLPQKPTLNWQRAYDYLVHGDYDSRPESFFSEIQHLQPGHLLVVDLTSGDAAKPVRWWRPQIQERTDLSFTDATEQLRTLFLDSIRLHLRSDVTLGAALSGGIDSSAVVCAMRHVEPDLPIHTFSYIAAGSDVSEEAWVDRVNAHTGATPHKIAVNADELAYDLDTMIAAQGEPFGSTSIYAQYRVFQLAKESGITVTLDGQGADEMLAGYSGYPGQRLQSLTETGHLGDAWRFLNNWSNWPGRNRSIGIKQLVAQFARGNIYEVLRRLNRMNPTPEWIHSAPFLESGCSLRHPRLLPEDDVRGRRVAAELALSLTQRGLPGLLRHGDRNSMQFSVESRVPFLTSGMVDFLLSLPESYLISSRGETKHIFRAAMRGIVPDEILDRRDKIGFATPEQTWLLSIANTVRDWLREDLNLPFFDQSKVLHEFDLIVAGKKPFSWQVWRWINFCRWHSRFLG